MRDAGAMFVPCMDWMAHSLSHTRADDRNMRRGFKLVMTVLQNEC